MTSYNYSYNVLINRLEAFAAGHFLIRRFTHGQIDMSDQLQDDQYPFMHVTPDTIEPVPGAMNFGFHIMFADIPRDKEYKAEYQREVISDCIRLGQDLIAEVKNGLELFGFDVQLLETPTFEPFMEEQKNTVTGVAFTLKLSVPWDWSACDIPAIWSVGGTSGTGGDGTGYGITLRTNGVDNVVQTLLDLVEGTGITITDNGNGSVTIDSEAGLVDYVSTAYNANHTTATGNQYVIGDRVWYNGNVYQCIANNDAIIPTNTSYWTLVGAGYRLRQTPVDWNASTGDFQILNKPTIPAAQVNSDWNASSGLAEILNKPTIPAAQVNSDWNASSGIAQILNKPTLATVATTGSYTDLINQPSIPPAQVNSDWNAVSGVAQILNKPTIPAAQVNSDWNAVSGLAQILNKPTIPTTLDSLTNVNVPSPSNAQVLQYDTASSQWIAATPTTGGITSVGLTMPAAFTVAGSPLTGAGTLAVSAAGLATQYVRGDGQLANFPTTSGGGSSVSYYLNGSINQGTIGGSTYYQMSKTAIFGAGTNFTRTNAAGNGLIAQFITDANDPNVLLIPGGNFNLELYFSASSSGGSPSFYVELYKYNGAAFTLLATDVATPEGITNGTTIDAYFTALAVPPTTMALTDRLALRVFVTTSGRTLVLHTENSHLCQVITTLSTGVIALNGLTAQVQNLAVGTAGADFGISSAASTHTFNLPTASASNRGALSTADWATFNGKLTGNAAITSATKTKITYDSKGLVTAGADLAASDMPTGIDAANIGAGTVSNTEFGYLDGVSSALQTQLNGKQNTIGLTTVGNALATLTNPNARTFLRVNADNLVTPRTPAEVVSDLGIATMLVLNKDMAGASAVNTTTNTQLFSAPIPANLLQVNDFLELFTQISTTVTNTNTLNVRVYVNNANNLTGATLLGIFTNVVGTGNAAFMRNFFVTAIGASGNIRGYGSAVNATNPYALTNAAMTNTTINTTVNNWIILAVQMSGATFTTTLQGSIVKLTR